MKLKKKYKRNSVSFILSGDFFKIIQYYTRTDRMGVGMCKKRSNKTEYEIKKSFYFVIKKINQFTIVFPRFSSLL